MKRLYSLYFVFLACALNVQAAQDSVQQSQINTRQQQQQNEINAQVQTQQIKPANIRLTAATELNSESNPPEKPCYSISNIFLTDFDNPPKDGKLIPSRYLWAQYAVDYLRIPLPTCLGAQGINHLLRGVQNRLIDLGFVTTRVVVEPQDLRSGILVLTLIPGKVGHIQLQDQSTRPFATRGTLWFAFPTGDGNLLNIRDLEQGLENLRRVPDTEAQISLQPGEKIAETDVLIGYKQHFPLHLTLGLDDSGTKATGRLQGTATLLWENPLRLNDVFYLSGTRSFKRHSDDAEGAHGSKNISLYYSIPWQNYALTLSGSKYDYHQTIAGAFENYQYRGESRQVEMTLSRLLARGQSYKSYLEGTLWARNSANYINDTEIAVQRRRTAGWQAGLRHTQYLGQTTLQLSAHYKRGTGAHGALRAPEEAFDEGTSRMQILTASVELNAPFMLGQQPWRFNSLWRAQWNQTPLVQQDKFSIGGRYTVRGFDGELTLSGERGWLWRNELAWNVMNKGQEWYLGVDTGLVRSSQEELQVGNRLTGGVVGLRGQLFGLNYDYFIGTPLQKPQGFRASHITTGFSVSYRF